ncbi:hypothetical protein EDB81DRAFT_341536 [Dactylonectria macrodidyma]|uniref:Uncharacterized protein n=1 Tax=Dactylonectria macrodidyma TaxID=307937 RepID=A0A9P9FHS0_9HYPO|nr:hypothetical protein EDB81DRAFT_341536 [Dactylonectria macrodidyma]
MHVLGHGFGQRRKSSHRRPRDLHIRKVSFSGSSLSSGCSLSSSTSSTPTATPTARTPTTARLDVDPLQLNPTFHAPPRLFERPFKDTGAVPVFCDDEEDVESIVARDVVEQQPTEMALPPHVSPEDFGHERQEPSDYFYAALAKRPPMPRSRWSESTVQTLDFEVTQDEDESSDSDEGLAAFDDSDDESVLEMRRSSRRISRRSSDRAAALQTLSLNVTYNLPSAPKRPPMRSLDTVDTFIRRGGWKRRGIVFHAEDMNSANRNPERASC